MFPLSTNNPAAVSNFLLTSATLLNAASTSSLVALFPLAIIWDTSVFIELKSCSNFLNSLLYSPILFGVLFSVDAFVNSSTLADKLFFSVVVAATVKLFCFALNKLTWLLISLWLLRWLIGTLFCSSFRISLALVISSWNFFHDSGVYSFWFKFAAPATAVSNSVLNIFNSTFWSGIGTTPVFVSPYGTASEFCHVLYSTFPTKFVMLGASAGILSVYLNVFSFPVLFLSPILPKSISIVPLYVLPLYVAVTPWGRSTLYLTPRSVDSHPLFSTLTVISLLVVLALLVVDVTSYFVWFSLATT